MCENHARERQVKVCSQSTIAAAIYFSQLMGCTGFSVVVATTARKHLK